MVSGLSGSASGLFDTSRYTNRNKRGDASARPGEGADGEALEAASDELKKAGDELAGAGKELSEEAKAQITELSARDREVRAHEAAHMAAGGSYITSGASYSFQIGPDGKQYAIGGEVGIDVSSIAGNPSATIAKMSAVRAAALAPANPSGQDMAVAAAAAQIEAQARMQLSKSEPANADAAMKSAADHYQQRRASSGSLFSAAA